MTKDAILEVALNADFIAAAGAIDRDPSQVVADLMRAFVTNHRRDYHEFLQAKVDEGRRCAARGEVYGSSEVEAEFADLREGLRAKP